MAKYETMYEFLERMDQAMPYIITGLVSTALLALGTATYLIYLLLDFIWGLFIV